MDRRQFMEQLERLLFDISETERQEAMEYYEEYFDDAGEENESEVIRELGSPGKVIRRTDTRTPELKKRMICRTNIQK